MVPRTIDSIFILLLLLSFYCENTTSVKKITKLSSKLESQTKTFSLVLERKIRSKIQNHNSSDKQATSNKKIKLKRSGEYTTKIEIGEPPQEILVIIDSGSSLLHIASPKCFKTCKAKLIYDHTKSKSFTPSNKKTFHQSYATGELVSRFASDTVMINNIKIKDQLFGYVEKQNEVLDHVGGILGLAYPRHHIPEGNLFQNLINQKRLQQNVIGYYINPKGGSLQFGYIDHNLYKGPLNKHNVVEKGFRWTIKINDILVDGKPSNVCGEKGCRGLIDTGTTDLLFPKRVFSSISKFLQNSNNSDDLKKYPVITYVIDGINYNLKPKNYIHIKEKENKKIFKPKACEFDLSDDDDIWIIGDPFFSKFYTVFDRDNDAIHIGRKNKNLDI